MERILEPKDFPMGLTKEPLPENWTAIIPAAGKGLRLGGHLPKVLYPILGKPMIRWMIDLLKPFCGSFVFVLSEENQAEVTRTIEGSLPKASFSVAIQTRPEGMADAVLCAEGDAVSRFSLVVWADQVSLRSETIAQAIRAHEARPNALLTFPSIIRSKPYIECQRDRDGRIVRVLQAREGEILSARAESDCGLFLFNTRELFRVLTEAKRSRQAIGKKTGEFNLLPLIPLWDRERGNVVALRVVSEDETLGVNTPQEAARVEDILMARRPVHG
jgi:bifunctional UDP-N-acetylglucosamine pyrophosphorylase/glucosamine-1-phosphate N-acetyltransferase